MTILNATPLYRLRTTLDDKYDTERARLIARYPDLDEVVITNFNHGQIVGLTPNNFFEAKDNPPKTGYISARLRRFCKTGDSAFSRAIRYLGYNSDLEIENVDREALSSEFVLHPMQYNLSDAQIAMLADSGATIKPFTMKVGSTSQYTGMFNLDRDYEVLPNVPDTCKGLIFIHDDKTKHGFPISFKGSMRIGDTVAISRFKLGVISELYDVKGYRVSKLENQTKDILGGYVKFKPDADFTSFNAGDGGAVFTERPAFDFEFAPDPTVADDETKVSANDDSLHCDKLRNVTRN